MSFLRFLGLKHDMAIKQPKSEEDFMGMFFPPNSWAGVFSSFH
jgi:hypothetical protein